MRAASWRVTGGWRDDWRVYRCGGGAWVARSPTLVFLNLSRYRPTSAAPSAGAHTAKSAAVRESYGPCLTSTNTEPSASGIQECHVSGGISKPTASAPGPTEILLVTQPVSSNRSTSNRPRITTANSRFAAWRCGRKYESRIAATNIRWIGSDGDSWRLWLVRLLSLAAARAINSSIKTEVITFIRTHPTLRARRTGEAFSPSSPRRSDP